MLTDGQGMTLEEVEKTIFRAGQEEHFLRTEASGGGGPHRASTELMRVVRHESKVAFTPFRLLISTLTN